MARFDLSKISGVKLNLMAVMVLFNLLLFVQESKAQSQLEDFSNRRSVKQDDLQMIFFVRDEDKSRPNTSRNDSWYHWFKSQKIITTQGGSDGLLLEGLFTAFFTNKQLAQKGSFQKGLKVKSWEYWRMDGSLKMTEQWRRGALIQKEFYDEEGSLIRLEKKSLWKNKVYTSDSIWIHKGEELVQLKTYNSIGTLKTSANYKNGVLNGSYKEFENGKLISKIKYKDGVIVPAKKDLEKEVNKEPSKFSLFWKNLFKKKEKGDDNSENRVD